MQSMLGMTTMPAIPIFPAMAKTKKPAITGPCPELARLVLTITGDVTRHQAEIRVGGAISHHAIARMWAGYQPAEGTILRFASGYDVDPNPLLEAAGYPPLPARQAPTPKRESDLGDGEEIERFRDPEDGPSDEERLKWIAAYDNLPIKIRESMLQQAEATLEAMYQQRSDIVGKRVRE